MASMQTSSGNANKSSLVMLCVSIYFKCPNRGA